MSVDEVMQGKVVLAVDDNEAVLNLVTMSINNYYNDNIKQLIQTTDPNKALAMFKGTRTDLVVTDWSMPGMMGSELVEHIRAYEKEQGYARTPIIAVSGDNPKDILRYDVDGVIEKPLNFKEFKETFNPYFLTEK